MKKNEIIKKEDTGKNNNKSVFIVLSIAALIIIICIVAIISRYNSAHFKYIGIEFNKNYMGEVIFYTAKVPAVDSYGHIQGYKEIDFRNDPRNLKDVSVNTSGIIRFIKNNLVYVSYGPMKQCPYSSVAAVNLGILLASTNLNYKGAVDDIAYENNTVIPHVNCQTNPDNTVILIKEGNETKIEQTGINCYEVIFKECEILKATEKFELTILDQYMNGFKSVD